MEEYFDNQLLYKHDSKGGFNYHKCYQDQAYTMENFNKDKYAWYFKFTYDFNNPIVKEYMTNNPSKFKLMCLVNIFLSKKIKGREFRSLCEGDKFYNLFKEYASKYIDIEYFLKEEYNMKIIEFDNAYNYAFKNNTDKHRRFQKSKLKNEYKKYLECNDINKCKLKETLILIIAIISLQT